MESLPALRTDQSTRDRYADLLVAGFAKGKSCGDISREMYPGRDQRPQRRRLYHKLRHMALQDPRVASGVVEGARLALMKGLIPASEALAGRASRGRPDAIKLLYEASGFHNPRVKHEHTGEIKVKLEMPRPRFEQDITDAEVVE